MSSIRKAVWTPGGSVLEHDFMVDDGHEGPSFAAWYLIAAMLDSPDARLPDAWVRPNDAA